MLLIKKIIQIHIVSQLDGTPKLHVACRAWLIVHTVMHQFSASFMSDVRKSLNYNTTHLAYMLQSSVHLVTC